MQYDYHPDAKYPHEVRIPDRALIEFDDDRYRLTDEVVAWMVEMVELPFKIKYAYWDGKHRMFFMSKQDAMKFKLAWS